MKKLIAIVISFIFIFEGTSYGLRVPQGDFRRIASVGQKSLAEKEVMARIEKIKSIAGQVDIKELKRLRAIRDAADAEVKKSRTEETKDAQNKAEKDYTDKIKEMQVKHLESLIDANQLAIEIFDIILKLDVKSAGEVTKTMLEESAALKEWAYKYIWLEGGRTGYSNTICNIAVILLTENLDAEAIIKDAKEYLEQSRWATGKLDCPRPEFESEKEKKEYIERTEIAIRWMKHDNWNTITYEIVVILDYAKKMPGSKNWNHDIESKLRGILGRFILYNHGRDSKVFYEHEIYEYVYVLRILKGLMENEIKEHIDISRLNEDETRWYIAARQKILDVVEDSLSLIEGDITKRQSDINLAETVQEAFYDIISKDYIEIKKKQGVEIDLELENMEGIIFKGDQRKILNMFRVLFNNSWQVWQERNDEAREKLQGMEVFKYRQTPLKIKISFKLEQGKPMFEISVTDNAGGVRKDKTLLDYSKEEPDRQIAFLLNITRRKGDTGLGLAEVWWLVKLHKGRVRFDNLVAEGGEIKGAKFTIELPSDRFLGNTISRSLTTGL